MYDITKDLCFLQNADIGEECLTNVLEAYKRAIQFIENQHFDMVGYRLCEFNFLINPETEEHVGYIYAFIKNNRIQSKTGYFEIWYEDFKHITCFGRKEIKPLKL